MSGSGFDGKPWITRIYIVVGIALAAEFDEVQKIVDCKTGDCKEEIGINILETEHAPKTQNVLVRNLVLVTGGEDLSLGNMWESSPGASVTLNIT